MLALGNGCKYRLSLAERFDCTGTIINQLLADSYESPISGRDLKDGRGVRCGDHLPPHKYIKNIATCGTTPTEHILNAGRRPQTSQKARKSPCTRVGKKQKEKTDTKE